MYNRGYIMKRKIIKQGHNTLTITLPSEWTKRFNIDAGSEIEIIEKDNGLLLTTDKNGHEKKAEFNIDTMDIPTIWKYFMAVYREGYDTVLVKFSPDIDIESPYKFFAHNKLDVKYNGDRGKKNALEFLNELVNRFIGFEIVDYGKNFALIKEMTEPTSKEFDIALRRIFLLIEQMSEETCTALRTSNPENLKHIHDIDINLDKFHDYCIRILNKLENKETRKISLLFSTLFLMELIGDEYKNISHHLLYDFPEKIRFKNVLDIAETVKEQLDLFYSLYYKFEQEKINKISDIDKKRYFNVSTLHKKIKESEEKEIFHHLRVITRYINALTELRIEMEF